MAIMLFVDKINNAVEKINNFRSVSRFFESIRYNSIQIVNVYECNGTNIFMR